MNLDVIVIGGGLAGALTAFRFVSRGRGVCLVDDGRLDAGTRVAAGVINPISGQRLAMPKFYEAWLPETIAAYRELEVITGRVLIKRFPAVRIFQDAVERDVWIRRSAAPVYRQVVGRMFPGSPLGRRFHAPHGAGEVLGVWVVDMSGVVEACLESRNLDVVRVDEHVGWNDVTRRDGLWHWGEVAAPWIVWCDGPNVLSSPFAREIPWEVSVGEILKIRVPGLPEDHVVFGAKYLVPVGGERFLVGATYDRSRSCARPSEAGREELVAVLDEWLQAEWTVEAHQAGMRVNTRRRAPLAGVYDENRKIALLNGLGSRGALCAPVLAERLVRKVETGEPMPTEVDPDTHRSAEFEAGYE